jgi:hypothetical protein
MTLTDLLEDFVVQAADFAGITEQEIIFDIEKIAAGRLSDILEMAAGLGSQKRLVSRAFHDLT